MKNQVRAYFHESKWLHQKHIPTVENKKRKRKQREEVEKAEENKKRERT